MQHRFVHDVIGKGADERRTDEPLVSRCVKVSIILQTKRQCQGRTIASQDLRDTVLLMQERLLVHFIEQATFTVPGGNGLKKFLSLYFRPNIAHLDDDEGVLTFRSRREENIGIELPRRAFDTVTEMLDERRRSGSVEATVEIEHRCQETTVDLTI